MRTKTTTKPIRSRRPNSGVKIKLHTRGFQQKHENRTAVTKYRAARQRKHRMVRESRRRNRA